MMSSFNGMLWMCFLSLITMIDTLDFLKMFSIQLIKIFMLSRKSWDRYQKRKITVIQRVVRRAVNSQES